MATKECCPKRLTLHERFPYLGVLLMVLAICATAIVCTFEVCGSYERMHCIDCCGCQCGCVNCKCGCPTPALPSIKK